MTQRKIGALAALAGVCLLIATAWAGSVGDWAQPHLETIQLAKHFVNSANPNGRDSISFYLEGTTKALGAAYDTSSATDTLTMIPLLTNFGVLGAAYQTKVATGPTGDSLFVGRLTLNFDPATSTLASTDSFFVMTDVTADGVNWLVQPNSYGGTAGGGYLRASAVSNGTTYGGGACVVIKDLFSLTSITKLSTGIEATKTMCDCAGAKAIRFRISMGITSKVKKINSATWTYVSGSPNRGQ